MKEAPSVDNFIDFDLNTGELDDFELDNYLTYFCATSSVPSEKPSSQEPDVSQKLFSFEELPIELISKIFFTDHNPTQIARLAEVSKVFSVASKDWLIWHHLIKMYFPSLETKHPTEFLQKPRELFIDEYQYLQGCYGKKIRMPALLQFFKERDDLTLNALEQETAVWINCLANVYMPPLILEKENDGDNTVSATSQALVTPVIWLYMAKAYRCNSELITRIENEHPTWESEYEKILKLAIRYNDHRVVEYILEKYPFTQEFFQPQLSKALNHGNKELFNLFLEKAKKNSSTENKDPLVSCARESITKTDFISFSRLLLWMESKLTPELCQRFLIEVVLEENCSMLSELFKYKNITRSLLAPSFNLPFKVSESISAQLQNLFECARSQVRSVNEDPLEKEIVLKPSFIPIFSANYPRQKGVDSSDCEVTPAPSGSNYFQL